MLCAEVIELAAKEGAETADLSRGSGLVELEMRTADYLEGLGTEGGL